MSSVAITFRYMAQQRRMKSSPIMVSSCQLFIEAPHARQEDDGVILSVVLNARKGNSFLLVLDAHSVEEIGRAEIPHHIPSGFHGIFCPEVV